MGLPSAQEHAGFNLTAVRGLGGEEKSSRFVTSDAKLAYRADVNGLAGQDPKPARTQVIQQNGCAGIGKPNLYGNSIDFEPW